MSRLSRMDHTAQTSIAIGLTDFSTAVKDFLRTFAEQHRVVTKADVEEFAASFKAKRGRRGLDDE